MEKNIELELENIVKIYEKNGKKELANDSISLKIYQEEIVGLIGESGSGKSTLAKIILGLEIPDNGNIYFENIKLNKKTRKIFSKNVQVIFQNPIDALDPKMKVLDIVAEPLLLNKAKDKNKIKEKVKEMLSYVNLEGEYYERKPSQLSGGQCQRVAIARALISCPKLLLCDEITSALDVINQYNIIQIIKKYAKEHKTTILFITHNIKLAKKLCNRIVVMKDGKIIEENSTDLIFKNSKMHYTKMLIN